MKKVLNLKSACSLVGALLLVGCNTTSGGGAISKAKPIDHIQFNLPAQIEWVAARNENTPNGGMVAEWIPKGYQSNNSPVRVIYQRLVPAKQPNILLAETLKPIKQVCTDSINTPFKAKSLHSSQTSSTFICAQLGKNQVGLVTQNSIFADAAANHYVIAEVKTLPSKKAGELTFNNEREKQQVQNTQALIGLMRGFMDTIRVCDAEKNCR